jgi:predicted ABC-type ATPase
MIKLTKLLYEIIGSPKAIIMAGSAGAGKTYIVNTFKNDAKGWLNFNPDKYARNPESPFYKNLYQASKATDTELTGALESQDKSNFIWDTTFTANFLL